MKRYITLFSFAVLLLSLGATGRTQAQSPAFGLTFDAPANAVEVSGGSTASYTATGQLTTLNLVGTDPGAQGWSISMGADGGGKIVDATTAGTIVDTLFDGGFNKTELTSGALNEGAVSAVVLSFSNPVTLPPTGSVDIIKLTVEATAKAPRDVDGDEELDCDPVDSRVFYLDGRKGSGQPVDNKVTYKGQTVLPTKVAAITRVCAILPPRQLTFRVDVVGGDSSGKLEVPPGSGLVDVTAAVHLVSHLTPADDPLNGAQGWSISVKTDPCFNIASTTTAGADGVDPFFTGGFNKTEVVDPAKNSGQQGAVSAIVLSFTEARNLPPESDKTVLFLSGKIDAAGLTAPAQCTDPCSVAPVDASSTGLRGSGQPVQTAVTVAGNTKKPGVAGAAITLCQRAQISFIRGNANSDDKVDIGDAIWIINELFRGGPATACPDAADANDNGSEDLDDAVYLIDYEFKGSLAPPPAPFPACGPDPTDDGLLCSDSAPGC